jgi:hypothetical protein
MFTNGNVLFDKEHVKQISTDANKIYNFIQTDETSDEEIKKDLTVISGVSYFLNNTNFRNFDDPNYQRYIKTTWNVFVPFGYDNNKPIEGAEYYYPKLNYNVYGIMIQYDGNVETPIEVPLTINSKGELGYAEIRKIEPSTWTTKLFDSNYQALYSKDGTEQLIAKDEVLRARALLNPKSQKIEPDSTLTWNTRLFDTGHSPMYAKAGLNQLRVIDGYYTHFHVFLDMFGNQVETTDSDKEIINGKQLYKQCKSITSIC